MKIFHIIDSAGIYGAEMVLLNLLQGQLKMGLSPLLCSVGDVDEDEKPLETTAQALGIPVCKVRIPRGLKLKSGLRLLREAKNFKADIIHLHGYKDTILVGLLPGFFKKIPVVRTLHGWTSKTRLSKIWLYEKLDKFCLKRVDGIVSVNTKLVDQVQQFIKQSPVIAIENGISPLKFNIEKILQEDSKLAEFCRHGFVIGGIGRFSMVKGFHFLVEAMSLLVKKRPEIKLLLVGEGTGQAEMESIIQSQELGKHVFFTGYKQNAARYLPLLEIFVMPSLSEGLPIVLLEAMLAKVPIVATRVGGVPEVLAQGKYGKLAEPESAKSLAQSVLYVMDHLDDARLRAVMAEARVLKKYSSKRMAEKYFDFYHLVLAKKTGYHESA